MFCPWPTRGPYEGTAETVLTFAGSTNDPGDDTLTYEWDFDYDGTTFSTTGADTDSGVDLIAPTHTYDTDGVYMVALRVRDDDGVGAVDTAQVTIEAQTEEAPTATPTQVPTETPTPVPVVEDTPTPLASGTTPTPTPVPPTPTNTPKPSTSSSSGGGGGGGGGGYVAPTAIPTEIPTPTPTATPTPQPIATPTPTPEPTATPVPTALPTSSPLPTPSPTPLPPTAVPTPELLVVATAQPTPRVALAAPTAIPVPTATLQPEATPVLVFAKLVLQTEQSVSTEATGVDDRGLVVKATGEKLKLKKETGRNRIELPLELAEGRTLESFDDPGSGVTVEKTAAGKIVVNIPVKDEAGEIQMTLKATVNQLSGTGTSITGNVEKLELETPSKQVDLSADDSRVGAVKVSLSAELGELPDQATIQVQVAKQPDAEVQAGFERLAAEVGTEVRNVAFAVEVIHQNLDQVVETATLRMTVGRAWVDEFGLDTVRGFRSSDAGDTEILETRFMGFEGQDALFELISPNGLSVIALIALSEPVPQGEPIDTPVDTSEPSAESTEVEPEPTAVAAPAPTPSGSGFPLVAAVAVLIGVPLGIMRLRSRA